MSLEVIPTPPEEAARYLGTGLPTELNAQVGPDALTLWADYPYDEPALLAALAALGIEVAQPPQFSPCG